MQHLVLVAGYAGSGKTEYSKLLATRSGWPLLDKDTLTRPLVEALSLAFSGDPHDRQSAKYFDEIRPLEYQALFAVAWEVLEMGTSGVVVTAPFVAEVFDESWLENLGFDCELFGYRLTLVWVHCDPDTLRQRIVARGAERDRWKILNWSEWVATLREPPLAREQLVDNSEEALDSLQESVRELWEELKRDQQ